MSSFSLEEKKHILLFIMKNSLDTKILENEEKWQELGYEINHDWKEIRDAYIEWQKDDNNSITLKDKNEEEHNDSKNNVENCDIVDDFEVKNDIKDYNKDEIQYVNINGELFNIENFEDYLLHDNDVFNTTVYDDQDVVNIRKRPLDLNDFDIELLKTFEVQSHEELELKRKEHEKKMKLYKMQLDFAAEVHQEKMKILKTKLQFIQEQMYYIDHVICNKNLRRKFKSGPI